MRQEPRQASPVRFMLKTTLTAVIEEKKKKKRKLAMGAWQNAAAPSFRAELFLVFIKDSCSLFESTVQLLYAHVVYLNRSDRIAK